MKIIILIVLLVFVVETTKAAVAMTTSIDPKNPVNCLYENHSLAPNEEYRPKGKCYLAKCYQGGQVEITTCGVKHYEGCEKIGQANNEPYPKCCTMKFSCKTKDGKREERIF